MKRQITIELTEAEYAKLASAVALAEAEWAQDRGGKDVKALLAAWSKINCAWYGAQDVQS